MLYKFLVEVVKSMPTNNSINSVEAVNYLSRYSNNLIAVSPLQTIDIAPSEQNKERLFSSYVYESA